MTSSSGGIGLVVFDLAGTTVDHGCFAPVAPFLEALRRHGVEVSEAAVRAPMGLGKLDHLRALLGAAEVSAQWRASHGRDPNDADAETIYREDFVPLQLESVSRESVLIAGTRACVDALRARGIKIGTTTGYFAAAAEACWAAAARQGFVPDCQVHPEQVAHGRPEPWMIFKIMQETGVFPPERVVKVGDTVPDIEEGRNAGTWTVAVIETGSEIGLRQAALDALPADERVSRVAAARARLLAAGAHWTVDSVADLPDLLPAIESGIGRSDRAGARR